VSDTPDKVPNVAERAGGPDRVGVRFHEGEFSSASKLNVLATGVQRLSGGVAPPRVLPPNSAAARGQSQQMRVYQVRGDYLLCWTDDGGTTSIPVWTNQPLVLVAKPWLLRRSPFDTLTRAGITYTYDDDSTRVAADEDDHEEDQVVVPSYAEGDVIYATAAVAGGVMVRRVASEPASDVVAEWLDLNVDGRAWGSA
jgi:hypothetical protein